MFKTRATTDVSSGQHTYRRQNYAKYETHLNLDGLEFPLAVKDIAKFEAQNPTIAIHCIAADSKDKSFSILYLSPRVHQRDHTLTLLLLDDERHSKNHHYVFVKNLSRSQQIRTPFTRMSQLSASLFV